MIALPMRLRYAVLAKQASTVPRSNESEVIFMASIRKRGNSYLIVVSMGYDYNGKPHQAPAENRPSAGGADTQAG